MFIAGWLAALGGMLCIAATQSKQAELLFGAPLSDGLRRFAVCAGTALLLLSAGLGVQAYGLGVGLVSFCAWACFAGWIIALVLTRKRSRRRP